MNRKRPSFRDSAWLPASCSSRRSAVAGMLPACRRFTSSHNSKTSWRPEHRGTPRRKRTAASGLRHGGPMRVLRLPPHGRGLVRPQTTKIFVDTTNTFVVASLHADSFSETYGFRTRDPARSLGTRPFYRPRSAPGPQRQKTNWLHQRLKAHADHDRQGHATAE